MQLQGQKLLYEDIFIESSILHTPSNIDYLKPNNTLGVLYFA